jgi:hypothetical protein
MVILYMFFVWKDIVHCEFVLRGQMVNKQLFQEVPARLREAMRRKRPELWEKQIWMLHRENASAHSSIIIRSYLAKYQISVCSVHPIPSHLDPAERFFP